MGLSRGVVAALPALALLGCASARPLRPELEVRWCAEPNASASTVSEPASTISPVEDYDRPPRSILITRPRYPREPFLREVQGVVEVEIMIGPTGRVLSARVIRSIPGLDSAALDCVCQWTFEPAVKDGKPVACFANAPVGFRIYNDKDEEDDE